MVDNMEDAPKQYSQTADGVNTKSSPVVWFHIHFLGTPWGPSIDASIFWAAKTLSPGGSFRVERGPTTYWEAEGVGGSLWSIFHVSRSVKRELL